MTRTVYRFQPFTIRQDTTALPTYEARCVAGEEADCGASSRQETDPAPVERWMAEHTRDTGHFRFRRVFADYADVSPQ
jgi:hypothetical protein